MRDEYLGPTVTGDALQAELRRRRVADDYETVSGQSMKIALERAKLKELEGWRIVKKNAKSIRIARAKPAERQLEDDVWCLLAQMGFSEMSFREKFRISVGENLEPKQIDVFAKDDDTVIIVECTQAETPGKKTQRLSNLIDKLRANREEILKSIQAHYGRSSRLKVRTIISTRNIDWGDADKAKCAEAQILVLTDNELEYYSKLVSLYKIAARYQFLAHAFGGAKVEGLRQVVHATRGFMGGTPYYTFHVKPDDLMKIAYIGHKSSRAIDDLDTYQRLVVPNRLKEIARYINSGGKFPTNIVVNIKLNKGHSLNFEKLGSVGDDSYGELTLPPIYGCAWVIDGQHRLYGYAYARDPEAAGFSNDKTTLPVLAFENLDPKEEMKLFADINSKQVNVKRDLLEEIHSELFWESTDIERGFNALLSRIPAALNTTHGSPFFDRMKVTIPGKSKGSQRRCLTLTSLRDGLEEAKLAGALYKGTVHHGPFVTGVGSAYKENLKKCSSTLIYCFETIRKNAPKHWEAGDAPGVGYLCTNNGIRATFLLLRSLCDHVETQSGESFFTLSAESISEHLSKYLVAVAKYFDSASPSQIARIRTGESSKSAVERQALDLAEIVHERFPEFSPPKLKEHIESRDMRGTERAQIPIDKISVSLNRFVVRALKQAYGEDYKDWWAARIPQEVMTKASARRDEEKWANPVETYVDLGDYQRIAIANWDIMGVPFALGEKDADNKKKVTGWIDRLVRIRRTTHHREKGPASKDEVQFVEETWKKIQQCFPRTDLMDD